MLRARRGGFVLNQGEHPGRRTSANLISFPQDGSERPQSFCFHRASCSGRWGRRQQCSSRQRVGTLGCAQRAGARASCAVPHLLFPKMAKSAKMRVFRYYGTRSRAASSRKTLTGKSGLPELAPLLQPDRQSAPSPPSLPLRVRLFAGISLHSEDHHAHSTRSGKQREIVRL